MFENVLVSGCSLTYGEELVDQNDCWANVLALRLGAKNGFNYAQAGVSNDIIAQNAINAIIKHQDTCTPNNTLVVVMWTYCTRLNFMGKKDNYYTLADFNLTPLHRKWKLSMGHTNVYFNDDFDDIYDLQSYYKQHCNPLYLLYNTTKLVHHTQTFLKSKGYKYIFAFCDSHEMKFLDVDEVLFLFKEEREFHKDVIPPFLYMMKDIDRNNFFTVPFMDFTAQNNYPVGPMNHPLEKGHYEYGSLLSKHVKEKFNV